MDFAIELEKYGPDATASAMSVEQARQYVRRLAASHYENFPVLSIFLPRQLREHFSNVYAFCRWADDLGDEIDDPRRSLALLDWWENELDKCYLGKPSHPVMIALEETIARFAIPREPFRDLIDAFRQDQTKVRYDTYDEILDYCRRSANPVGRLVLYLCERHEPENARLSDDVCTGLQLINFWQDVVRDYAIGRVYLPKEDLDRFDVAEEQIAEKRFNPAFADLMRFEVARAEELLQSGRPLSRRLSGRLRLVIWLFAAGGLAVARKIHRQDFDVLSRRPKLGKFDVVSLTLRALCGR